MATKELMTRIALKYDSYANWTSTELGADKGANLVLLKGEIGICEIPNTNADSNVAPTVLFKVGGAKYPAGHEKAGQLMAFKDLPWASAKAADVYTWAKSETVVLDGTTIKFKTGDKVNHSIDLSSFATDAEVETVRSGLDSRITALEGKFTGDNDVQGQLDALDGRLDVIEGADTVEGSVAKALKDAKAYTDTREAAIETAYKAYADQAEADANTYTDGKVTTINAELTSLDGRLDVIEGEGDGSIKKAVAAAVTEVKAYADTAESDAVATAKSYTDAREAAIKTAYEAYADQAEADAKTYSDGKLSTAVSTINAKDQEQDTEIGKKLDAATFNEYIDGKSMSDADLKKYAEDKADAAQSAAIAAAKTETEGQISTLVTSGQVKTNKEDIAGLKAADTEIRGLISAEQSRAEGIEGGLRSDVDNIKAFFATAENETLDTALDTLKEIQDYLNGEGTATNGMLGRLTQAETDIDNLEKEFNTDAGRVKVAEGKIAALEAKDAELAQDIATKLTATEFTGWKATHENGHAKSAAEITSEINTAVSGEKSAREAADTAINEKIGGSYSKTATVEMAIADAKAAGTGAASEAARAHERLDVVEPKVTTLQDIVNGYTDKGSIKTAVDAAQKAADDAQDAADKAQGEIDALELVVGNADTGLAAAHTKANTNAADISALDKRVTTAEGEIDALQATVDTATTGLKDRMTAAEGSIKTLQDLTGDASKGNEALHTELTRVAGLVDNGTTGLAATKVIADRADAKSIDNAKRLDAIEGDYLKEADLFIINCGSASTVLHTAPTEQ